MGSKAGSALQAIAIITAIAATIITGGLSTALYATSLGASVGSGLVARSQAKKQQKKLSSQLNGLTNDTQQFLIERTGQSYVPVLYGNYRVAGTRVYVDTTDNNGVKNAYLHLVHSLAEGEVEGVQEIYIDNEELTSSEKYYGAPFTLSGELRLARNFVTTDENFLTFYGAGSSTSFEGAKNYLNNEVGPGNYFRLETQLFTGVYKLVSAIRGTGPIGAIKNSGIGIRLINTLIVEVEESLTYQAFVGSFDISKLLISDSSGNIFVESVGNASGKEFSTLITASNSKWTSNHLGKGVAAVYIRLLSDSSWTQFPLIQYQMLGKLVYDPRTSLTAYSNNAALCIRDFLTNTIYGAALTLDEIDDASFQTAANDCDTFGYTINGIVDTTVDKQNILFELLASCRGDLIRDGNGKFLIIIDQVTASTFAFTEDNMIGDIDIILANKNTRANRIVAKFFNLENHYEADTYTTSSETYLAADNNTLLEEEIELPFTSDLDTVAKIANIELNKSRRQIQCFFKATYEAINVAVGDVVTVTIDDYSFIAKEFRVTKIKQKPELIEFSGVEYDSEVYDAVDVDLPTLPPGITVPNYEVVGMPGNITSVESLYVTTNGSGVKTQVDLLWIEALDSFVYQYQVEYKLEDDTSFSVAGITNGNSFKIRDLSSGLYNFRVKSLNIRGNSSAYSSIDIEVGGLFTAPNDIENFSFAKSGSLALLSWDTPLDIDVKNGGRVEIRYSSKTTGALWENSIVLVSASGTSNSVYASLLSGTYLAKARNSENNYSTNAATIITTIANSVVDNEVFAVTDSTFSGTKTNCLINDDGQLTIEYDSTIDDIVDIDLVDNIDTEGGVYNTAEYELASSLDLTAVYNEAALSYDLDFVSADDSINIDGVSNWDAVTDIDDIGNVTSLITAIVFYRVTNDNPAGSPTWSAWTTMTSGVSVEGRAYEFKIKMTSSSDTANLFINSIAITADMPDREEKDTDIVISASGSTINFLKEFRVSPTIYITVKDLATGDYFTLSSVTSTSFFLRVFDSSDVGKEATVNWLAKGYGLVTT
jgi:hypothetical protein